MSNRTVPVLPRWPFLLSDALLLVTAAVIVARSETPLGLWQALLCFISVAMGAWLCATPFLVAHRTACKLAETDALTTVVEQVQGLELVAGQISAATAQWQTVQEVSAKTVASAKDVAERMASEAKAFTEFLQKANDSEKNHLRLEVEKLRRGEGEWLQIMVHVLDHVFALHKAGGRSGQPGLAEQLRAFENVCRETVRRVGLVPFEAQAGHRFDSGLHQAMETMGDPPPDSQVAETVAAGYTFQGRLLRRALVSLLPATHEEPAPINSSAEAGVLPFAPPAESASGSGQSESTPEAEPANRFGEIGPTEDKAAEDLAPTTLPEESPGDGSARSPDPCELL